MKSRFEGTEGRRLLIEALRKQDIFEHNDELASLLAEKGDLIEFEPNAEIVVQDGRTTMYISSSPEKRTSLSMDDSEAPAKPGLRSVRWRLFDPSAPRSGTVRAKGNAVALKVTALNLKAALDAHPAAYKPFAQHIATRLRQTTALHQPPIPKPVLFLGCSTEGLKIARAIQSELKYDPIEVQLWLSMS